MNTFNFIIPVAPVTKKNHQQIVKARGRYMVIPSPQYKKYVKAVEEYLPHLDEPINEPIELKCLFYMPTHRACDLTNLLQAICDVLAKKVIADDNFNIVASVDGSRVFYDKDNPRTEITITPINCSIEDR